MPQFNIQDLSKDSRQRLHDLAKWVASDMFDWYNELYWSTGQNSLWVWYELYNKNYHLESTLLLDAWYLMWMMRALEILFWQDWDVFVRKIMTEIK